MVDIRDLSEEDSQRAYWLFFDTIDYAGNVPAVNEFLNIWADGRDNVSAGALFLFAAYGWPAVLELCARKGISKSDVNNRIAEIVKQDLAEYLRKDVTPEEVKP